MRHALLAIVLLGAACAPAAETVTADLLLTGGSVVVDGGTIDEAAVAVRAGRVLAVGRDRDIDRHRGRATTVVELGGAVVVPAWVDHHVHLMNVGLSLLNAERGESLYLDLAGDDLSAIGDGLRDRAEDGPDDGWLLGKGWSQAAWGTQALPDATVLDAVSGGRPAFLGRTDGHAAWVNSAALEAAGIGRSTPNPPGGRIVRRSDGTPSGILLERATESVQALLPRPSPEDVAAAFRRGAEALAAQGVVEVFDAGFLTPPGVVGLADDLGVYLAALVDTDRDRPLPLRINLMIPAPTTLAEAVVADSAAYRALTPRVGVTHLKLFADGAMGSRGAWISHAFADDPSTEGVPRMSREEIRAWSERALDAGLDVATHAIGNAAFHAVLGVYADLLAERTDLDPGRLRIEHVSYADAPDLRRAAELGVVLSVQPNFVYPDDDGIAMEDGRLGAERTATVYAWGTLASLGAELAFGSDYFTAPLPPLFTLHAAATRSNLAGRPALGWHPDERLPRATALAIMSTLYAPGGRAPHRHRVAVGEPADLVVLDADPLEAPSLPGVRVLATLVAGRTAHTDGTLAGLTPVAVTARAPR